MKQENKKTRVYYFSPIFDELERVPYYTQEECEYYCHNDNEVYVYSISDFETVFNDELISDLGYIRIF